MKINKYPDGTSYVVLENIVEESSWDTGGNYPMKFTFKTNTYEDLHHLEQIIDVYNHNGLEPLITIPNLLDAQADRRFNDNQSSGLKIVLKRLNSMNADFKIFHPHNPEVVEALMDNVEIIDNSEFVKEVFDNITFNTEDLILMSSDAGGFKPLMKLCDKIGWKGETYSASKARLTGHSETRMKQLVDRQDFKGKDILIIDDISVYGGTFKGLSKLLRERNCGKLYLAVSHMTVQNLGKDPVTNYFDKVFNTNSKFDKYSCEKTGIWVDGKVGYTPNNLEIIKLF
jgi:ribose-phosphate pyrophosphokinase